MVTQCSDSYKKTSVIRCHHNYIQVYISTPIIRKESFLEAQDDNEHEKHTVVVMKDGCVTGYDPRSISQAS